MSLRIEFDTTCPKCHQDAKVPPDVDGDSLFNCGACGERLVVKADIGTDSVKAWLVTNAADRAHLAALRAAEADGLVVLQRGGVA